MLYEQLRDEWHARKRAVPIYPVMTFASDGLVLGAGTVVVPAEGICRLKSLKGQEQRILALLSAAYGKAVSSSVLGNIERAGKAWSIGDDCLAYINRAHARLLPPDDTQSAACRLFIADSVMGGGVAPRAIFRALKLGSSYIDAVEKAYNPAEPRVPAGSGRTSGEWTDGAETAGESSNNEETGGDSRESTAGEAAQEPSLLARMALPATSFLAELDAAQAVELGSYAARLLGLGPVGAAVAAFGLLFIPSPNNILIEGEVPEIPGLRYSWNRGETALHLMYDRGGGAQRTFALQVDGDFIRDDDGQVVGRVIGGNRIAIDTLAVLPDLVKEDEPRLCPAPAPDVPGSDQGKTYEENRSRQYEDFVKLLVNPPPIGPTPSGFVFTCRTLRAAIRSATTIASGRTAYCLRSKARDWPNLQMIFLT